LATRIILYLTDGRTITALVHNSNSVSKLTTTSKQQGFRDALDSLGGNSPDFAALLRLADQLIFDERKTQQVENKIKTSKEKTKNDEKKAETPIGPLSVSVTETRRQQRRIRELHHGDLAYVIDMLIYHLGIGLREASDTLEKQGMSEEEQIGAEDDGLPEIIQKVEPFSLVKTCHGKVATLVSRMCKQFEKVIADSAEAFKAVEQILAVLAILREVRANDFRLSHLTEGVSLVPLKERKKLLFATLKTLFGSTKNIFDKTAEAFKDDPDNDMARLLGLIIWLAWDSDLDLRKFEAIPTYDLENREQALLDMARLLEIAFRAGKHDGALEEARHSAWRTTPDAAQGKASLWMQHFESWAKNLVFLENSIQNSSESISPKTGHLGVAIKEKKQKLRIIVGAPGNVVRFAEIGRDNEEVSYQLAAVKAYQMPLPQFGLSTAIEPANASLR